MLDLTREVQVTFRSGDLEVEFKGYVDDVVRSLLKFLGEFYPTWDLASKLSLKVDLARALESMEEVVAVAPEGPVLVVDRSRITDLESIWLAFAKAWVAYQLGLSDDYSLTGRDIQRETGVKPGTISARLSELASQGYLDKPRRGAYRLTSLGLKKLIEDIIPTVRGRMKVE